MSQHRTLLTYMLTVVPLNKLVWCRAAIQKVCHSERSPRLKIGLESMLQLVWRYISTLIIRQIAYDFVVVVGPLEWRPLRMADPNC